MKGGGCTWYCDDYPRHHARDDQAKGTHTPHHYPWPNLGSQLEGYLAQKFSDHEGHEGSQYPSDFLVSVLDMVEVVYESPGSPGLVIHLPESVWNRDLELLGVWKQRSLGSCYPNWKALGNVSHKRMCARFVHKATDLFLDFLPLLFG